MPWSKNAPLKYNFVVGAVFNVIHDIENSPTLKTKTKENLFARFPKCQILSDTVFCLIIIHIAIKSLATTIFLTSMMPIIVL
jgi:hypothetical protein